MARKIIGWFYLNCICFLWNKSKKPLMKVLKLLTTSVFSPANDSRTDKTVNRQSSSSHDDDYKWYHFKHPRWRRLGLGVGLRLLELPLIILLCIAFTVYSTVNPNDSKAPGFSPNAMGLYYENITINSKDGTELAAWFIPSINASEILKDGDKALTRKRPAAILAHGIGANREQMLPLASYLNNHGFEVLLFDFRSCGQSEKAPRSFGLNETDDVLAAVHYMKDQANVDPDRIVVIGQDMGGMACLRAAGYDPTISTVITADLYSSLHNAVEKKLAPSGFLCASLTSAYVWACKAYFGTNDAEFSAIHAASILNNNQKLLLVTREKNDSMNLAAELITQQSNAQTQKLRINKNGTCLLADTTLAAPEITQYILNSFESHAHMFNQPVKPIHKQPKQERNSS